MADHRRGFVGAGVPKRKRSWIKCVVSVVWRVEMYFRASTRTNEPREYPTSVTGRFPNARLTKSVPSTLPALIARAFAFDHGLSDAMYK